MLTREEAIYKGLKIGSSELGIDLSGVIPKLVNEIYNSFEQHIKSLEAQLANTERLTCKNCYHSTIFDESFRRCPCVSLIDEDGEPTSIVPNEFYCNLYHPKDTQ